MIMRLPVLWEASQMGILSLFMILTAIHWEEDLSIPDPKSESA